jgi:hypothetical protein
VKELPANAAVHLNGGVGVQLTGAEIGGHYVPKVDRSDLAQFVSLGDRPFLLFGRRFRG